MRATSLPLIACPASVQAASCRVFDAVRAKGALACTVHDSRLDDPEIDRHRINLVALAPNVRVELHIRVDQGTCDVVGECQPPWPTLVQVRHPDRTDEFAVIEEGRLSLGQIGRGPTQFVFQSEIEPCDSVHMERLDL